jgi:hypothetical protein
MWQAQVTRGASRVDELAEGFVFLTPLEFDDEDPCSTRPQYQYVGQA